MFVTATWVGANTRVSAFEFTNSFINSAVANDFPDPACPLIVEIAACLVKICSKTSR